jgi:hypothetical protein
MEPEVLRHRAQAPLQRTDDAGGDAGRMPVHAHDAAEGLEPERMRETPQQFVATIFHDDRLADDGAQLRHAFAQPLRHPAAMQRQVGASGSFHCIVPYLFFSSISMAGTEPLK